MVSNRDIEKLFDQWNPNHIRAGDRVQVSLVTKYRARVVGLEIDLKNRKVFANLKLSDNSKRHPIRVDVSDCYPIGPLYPGHHDGN
jgi:hypothetical protein